MSRLFLAAFALCLLIGCSTKPEQHLSARASSGQAKTIVNTESEFQVGEPLVYKNLTIFPVSSREPRNKDRFITLDEGLRGGTIQIKEVGSSGDSQTSTDSTSSQQTRLDTSKLEAPVIPDTSHSPRGGLNSVTGTVSAPANESDPFGAQTNDEDLFGAANSANQSTGGTNDVNRVLVLNESNRPLYLMPGEIIVGGDQDRAIGQELVIEPSKEPVSVEVFCVERGRWGGRGANNTELFANAHSFPSNLSLVISQNQSIEEAAEYADSGKFIASAGSLNAPARLAVQDTKSQSEVWKKVSDANAQAKVQMTSGAFTGQYLEVDAVQRLEPYVNALYQPIHETKQVVGVLVAVDGKVIVMDIFESTPLFRKLLPKLLKSYAVDAANAMDLCEESVTSNLSREDACRFLSQALHGPIEESAEYHGVAITKRLSEGIITYSAGDNAAEVMGGGFGGGGFHTSGFAR